ncbi:thiamine pyrophosphate-binding protein [Streptosporangium sp. NPDC051022]|uniref:thiamine pyrophosphate-binding protein n=1 Tax=Streptosporangium sp. NPDC051022 TaxID=3155752 RepID=UPI003413B3C4
MSCDDDAVSGAAETLVRTLADHGYVDFTGVPCSLLKGVFRAVEDPSSVGLGGRLSYFPAPREDTAVGVASGLAVAGRKPVVLMQNSGLGYCMNVLTSFNLIYDVHFPMVVSWRGHEGRDAVEHDVIGRELTNFLDVFDLTWTLFDRAKPRASTEEFLEHLNGGRHASVLIVDKEV